MRRLLTSLGLTLSLWASGTFAASADTGSFQRPHRIAPPCVPGRHLVGDGIYCYAPNRFRYAAQGLPFAAADPGPIVERATRLPGIADAVQRDIYPPTDSARFPVGPPESITTYFGSVGSARSEVVPPQRTATYVRIQQYGLSQTGKPRLWRPNPTGQWVFTADLPRQQMTIAVESDGPKEVVNTIGRALFTAESRAPVKRAAPERVYISAPALVHAGQPTTFWALVAPQWGTRPQGGGFDFDFTLGGRWDRLVTETPDGSQACGGDNIAGQPARRRGRWVFGWGDCPELGLTLVPRGTGLHTLTIVGYSMPVTARGVLDRKHEQAVLGSGYRWQGRVMP